LARKYGSQRAARAGLNAGWHGRAQEQNSTAHASPQPLSHNPTMHYQTPLFSSRACGPKEQAHMPGKLRHLIIRVMRTWPLTYIHALWIGHRLSSGLVGPALRAKAFARTWARPHARLPARPPEHGRPAQPRLHATASSMRRGWAGSFPSGRAGRRARGLGVRVSRRAVAAAPRGGSGGPSGSTPQGGVAPPAAP